MENRFFSSILSWLKSSEMFARPSKQIPAKWLLFEYYTEPDIELLHFTEEKLNLDKVFWNIEFKNDRKFSHKCNVPVSLVSNMNDGIWNISKNFITLYLSDNQVNSIEFQFSIDKGTLKLLKKDMSGKIEFFGFFKKLN